MFKVKKIKYRQLPFDQSTVGLNKINKTVVIFNKKKIV